jgi:hypothetical protein
MGQPQKVRSYMLGFVQRVFPVDHRHRHYRHFPVVAVLLGALMALRVTVCWGQGLPPFPAPLSPLTALFLRCAPDSFLDEAEHFLHNRDASVATLRWCSGSSGNAVWLPFGISVRLRRNPPTGPRMEDY